MANQIDAAEATKWLNSLAQNTVFSACRFEITNGNILKLTTGEVRDASTFLESSGTLSKSKADKFRDTAQVSAQDINIDNLKANLAARLLQKLTDRLWLPAYTPGTQAVDANQWSADETYFTRSLLRRNGIIKRDVDLRVASVPDGVPETGEKFLWDRASISTSDIDLNALQTTVEQMGKGRAPRT